MKQAFDLSPVPVSKTMCGPQSVYLAARLHNSASIKALDAVCKECAYVESTGASVGGLLSGLDKCGAAGSVQLLSPSELAYEHSPVILILQDSDIPSQSAHFLVFAGMAADDYCIIDPAVGLRIATKESLETQWAGLAICIPGRTVERLPSSSTIIMFAIVLALVVEVWNRVRRCGST